jgi:hypothetical protein
MLPAHKGRNGRVCSLQMDLDALQMLREIAPSRKAFGRYLSELVRREYIRRQDWQRQQDLHQAARVEVAGD